MITSEHTNEQILQAAIEANLWCAQKWDAQKPRESLRQFDIASPHFDSQYHTINFVVTSRRYALEKTQQPNIELNGKFLAYAPDENTAFGLPEAETEGFLDAWDCPPWGTWVGSKPRYAICWIPEHLCELVDRGMSVSDTEPCQWLEKIDEDWAKDLINSKATFHKKHNLFSRLFKT
jgi:hypothetical protein